MKTQSPSSQAIDAVLKDGAEPALKAAGFRRRGRTYWAEHDRVFRVVWFQASRWNSADEAKFTANMHVVFPEFHVTYSGKPFPKNPASGIPVVQDRIGRHLDPSGDVWWTVTAGAEDRIVTDEVRAAVPKAIEFLDGFKTRAALTERLLTVTPGFRAMRVLGLAVLLTEAGDTVRAAAVLRDEITSSEVAAYSDNLRKYAQRLGLVLTE